MRVEIFRQKMKNVEESENVEDRNYQKYGEENGAFLLFLRLLIDEPVIDVVQVDIRAADTLGETSFPCSDAEIAK